MEIVILKKTEEEKYYSEFLDMLKEADDEFFPPLSSRVSSTQADLKCLKKNPDGVLNYFEEMKKQRFLVSLDEGQLCGFVSYRENYTNSEIKEEFSDNIYLSTLIVKKSARGKGLTYKMYDKLFTEYKNVNIFTRTWSTNYAHIAILEKFGFDTYRVLENDRGEGIDTVYFIKTKENN